MSYKNEITVIIGTAIIVMLLFNYAVDVPVLKSIENEVISWVTIITSFALGLGFFNIVMVSYKRMKAAKTIERRIPQITLLIVVVTMTIIGLVATDKSPLYQFWFNTLHFSLHMTLNGLILFFLCSAAYRAMRIKNVGSGIMVITTILIALAAVPIGELIWPGFSVISSWLMDFPSAGANRALSLTTGIGIVIFGARVLFWKEKRVYGQ